MIPEHYKEGRLKGVAKKYAFQLSLFSSLFIDEQVYPDDNHVIRRGNAMLYRQVGTFLSYRQVDDMSGCCHWDKWVKQFRSHRPFGDTPPS